MKTFAERIAAYATRYGSTATTTRGQLRFLNKQKRSSSYTCNAYRWLSFGTAPIAQLRRSGLIARECQTQGPTARKTPTPESRETARFGADPKFRRAVLARLRRTAASMTASLEARLAAESRLVSLGHPLLPHHPRSYSLAPLHGDFARWLGYASGQCRDVQYSRGYRFATNDSPHVTEWKNGLPRTGQSASRRTTIKAVAYDIPGGRTRLEFEGRTNRLAFEIPHSRASLTTDGLLPSDWIGSTQTDGSVLRYGQTGLVDALLDDGTTGVAIRSGDGWEHGATIAECMAEIAHKRAVIRARAVPARAARLYARLRGHRLVVDFEAARSTGACRAGIESWCESRGIHLQARVPAIALLADSDDRARSIGLEIAKRALEQARADRMSRAA